MAPAGCSSGAEQHFLVWFAHHNCYYNMRFQELEALASLVGVTSRAELYVEDPPPTSLSASPLVRVRLPSEAAAKAICERSVLIKAILEVWAEAPSFEEAVTSIVSAEAAEGGRAQWERRRVALAPPRTFQIRVAAFGQNASIERKREVMAVLGPLFSGDEVADLRDPDTTVWALEEHDHHTDEKTHLARRSSLPLRVFVARQVVGGRSTDKKLASGEKAFFQRYDLAKRAVLGPTTLENELAFIMANCACASPGKTALEPFCGTGGLLVALSHFGVRCTAGEIDIRVVKGWRIAYTKNEEAAQQATQLRDAGLAAAAAAAAQPAPPAASSSGRAASPTGAAPAPGVGECVNMAHLVRIGIAPAGLLAANGVDAAAAFPSASGGSTASSTCHPPAGGATQAAAAPAVSGKDIFTNFLQYGLPLPEVVVCDNADPPWRMPQVGWVDCIVTDPPYGVRAASKKQGRNGAPVEVRDRSNYIPSKADYGEDDLNRDLLELAAAALTDNGRISFLLPVDLADFLGIDRAEVERGGERGKGKFRDAAHPEKGRKKDRRLIISETTRDPLLLDEARYTDFIPQHSALELVGASLQVLSGGLGRLLVTMRRRPR